MLITLLAWIMISFVSWIWGHAFFAVFVPGQTKKLQSFSLVCFTGFAVLMAVTSYLSLLTEINSYVGLSVFALSCLLLVIFRAGKVLRQNFLQSFSLPLPFLLLLMLANLLVLVMSMWHINHPDTVDYHTSIINSVKESGIIKGYANENIRYGLQSNWFVACALLCFDLSFHTILTFANSILLFWFLLYVTGKIAGCYKSRNYFHAFLLLILLCFSFWDYTQIRLTSTSASPDFITTIFILLTFHLFINQINTEENYYVLILFCTTAITIKLSSFILAFLVLYLITKAKNFKTLVKVLLLVILTIPAFLLRNYYTSGYILFPTSTLSFAPSSWKVNTVSVRNVQQYITAYARTASAADPEAVKKTLALPFSKWLPVWWHLRNLAQKVLLLSSTAALITGALTIKKKFSSVKTNFRISLLLIVAGLISWFLLAPDPRFGVAWLLLINALIFSTVVNWEMYLWLNAKVILSLSYILSFGISIYIFYRLLYYFDAFNLLFPYGLN